MEDRGGNVPQLPARGRRGARETARPHRTGRSGRWPPAVAFRSPTCLSPFLLFLLLLRRRQRRGGARGQRGATKLPGAPGRSPPACGGAGGGECVGAALRHIPASPRPRSRTIEKPGEPGPCCLLFLSAGCSPPTPSPVFPVRAEPSRGSSTAAAVPARGAGEEAPPPGAAEVAELRLQLQGEGSGRAMPARKLGRR